MGVFSGGSGVEDESAEQGLRDHRHHIAGHRTHGLTISIHVYTNKI